MRAVTFTIIGILTLCWVLATVEPPYWLLAEFFLLAAGILLVREYISVRNQKQWGRRTGSSVLSGKNAWFADADDIDSYTRVYHPWDSDQAAANTRKAAGMRFELPTHVIYSHKESVEQIAHDMLMQAFRHASRTHVQGGDPEDMRRVYAARDMIFRAIQKP